MSAASLVSFIGYCFSLNFAIQGINYSWADLQRGSTLLSHVMSILDMHTDTPTHTHTHTHTHTQDVSGSGSVAGEVVFKDVEFSYPNRPEIAVLRWVGVCLWGGGSLCMWWRWWFFYLFRYVGSESS
jgi:ABC-type multidrug transport system fused ATPase/permease subunit